MKSDVKVKAPVLSIGTIVTWNQGWIHGRGPPQPFTAGAQSLLSEMEAFH